MLAASPHEPRSIFLVIKPRGHGSYIYIYDPMYVCICIYIHMCALYDRGHNRIPVSNPMPILKMEPLSLISAVAAMLCI